MAETTSIPTCPMAQTCKGMMDKPGSGLWMMVPGILFIALGMLIMFFPQVLAWLIAIVLVMMGIMMLMMSRFIRGIGKRLQTPSD